MSLKNFKNYLKIQDEDFLRNELIDLYKTFEVVREFYVAEYEAKIIDSLPDNLKGSLPTIQEIEENLE